MAYATFIKYQIAPPSFMRSVGQTTLLASRNYHPQVYPGRVVLFRASVQAPGDPPDVFLGWDRVVLGGLEIIHVPGDHVSMMRPLGVEVVARELRGCMDRTIGRS